MTYRVRAGCVYLLGFFIDLVNMFIANVAYPEIAREFDSPVNQLAWISNSYILALTLVIPLSNYLAKRFGTKRLFMVSLMIFIIGCCGVGSSSSLVQLITWRGIQGMGGGMLIPLGQTMTFALFKSHERARLSSAVMLVALLAPALSPVIGGMLVESLSWRWVFFASVPLSVIALALAACWLKSDQRRENHESLDVGGLIGGCTGLTLILFGLTYLGDSQHFQQGGLLLLLGSFIMAGYVWNAMHKTHPLLNLRLVKDPLLQTAMLIYQFIPGLFMGVSMIAMLYLQNQLGMHASLVGAMMLPWSLASFAAITLTGKKFNTFGPRPLFISGCLIQATGIGLLAMSGHDADVVICISAFTLMGFGGSLCSSTAQSSAFIQIAENELADTSAIWNINRQLSFCLGVTLISLLFNVIADTGVPTYQAYHLCFAIAACSAVIPIACCFRIANQDIIFTLKQEQK